MLESTYRPHNPGHDYFAPGIYLITLVVRNRKENYTAFGHLNDDPRHADVVHNDIGKMILEEWNKIPAFEATRGRKVKVHGAVCMPDHFHGVIEVAERMDKSLGQVIWGFKVACTKRWRAMKAQDGTAVAKMAESDGTALPRTAESGGYAMEEKGEKVAFQPSLDEKVDLHALSSKNRKAYYALHPEEQQPLFDDNYDDTICINDPETGEYSERHFHAMLKYLEDNPMRAVIRRAHPEYMQRCLHVVIDGRDYAAFGNLFLLRWAKKEQVFCHRKGPDGITPYEKTEYYRNACKHWKKRIMGGATVIVTPGISKGELLIKNRCLEEGYPLIHIQKEPISRYWKPEKARFEACAKGSLLILAPWAPDKMGEINGVPSTADYSIFHNLNKIAADICLFEGTAVIKDPNEEERQE